MNKAMNILNLRKPIQTDAQVAVKRGMLWLLCIVATLAANHSAVAQSESNAVDRDRSGQLIAVSGEGEVRAKPDTVVITVGVITEAETAKQALTANNQAMQQLFEVLERQQIAERDRQTARFDISPLYNQEQPVPLGERRDAPQERMIRAYQVTNEVRVKVRQTETVGTVLDAVVSAGSNRIHGIEFMIEHRDQLMEEARRLAVRRAKEKAEALAEAAGVKLGKVLSIREGTMVEPLPNQQYMMAESRSVPIATGEQTVAASVQMTFQLDAKPE